MESARPFTIREAAERMGLSQAVVRKMVQLKQIAHYRIGSTGKAIRIERSEVEAYLAAHLVKSADATQPLPAPRRTSTSNVRGFTRLRAAGYDPGPIPAPSGN